MPGEFLLLCKIAMDPVWTNKIFIYNLILLPSSYPE